ncbi:ABC transporter substrate-binding protein [Mangrovibrevibacter kandeliae]|uniref:ABC transporter substrate-binding protein n=1 Tax=Mangrovibrevibacter kandeliae TaxID=2968473 RepID=UPI0021189729|nr:ABC transporter substrate-binding protein [Aurantimonas sp. CSK15Z-1]MCQ8784020.1 ABC transporter substrate-binding protein [Aurantimonas sp. CSK15Z-1]
MICRTAFFTALALLAGIGGPALAQDLDKVTFGTNWLAQAEHGGFYQAVADGTYKKYGLDVTIRQGGPQAANRNLLIAGQIDFYMGGTLGAFDAVKQGVPLVTVAAIFQKDPQVLMAHPDQGVDSFADLAKLPTIFMGKEGFITYFSWMKANYDGFSDEQFKPYQFNPAPFIADPKSAQQGFVTSEPFEVERQAGWAPKVFLLADQGYAPYATTIETQTKMVAEHPDVVQRFVDASIEGWYNYLYGDHAAADALIKQDNPEMSDDQMAFSLAKMKEYGIVVSGAAEDKGIGCMTDQRYKDFFDTMTKIGVVDPSLDYKTAYTLQFVCKGVGKDLAKS